jgi:hypothetical protein
MYITVLKSSNSVICQDVFEKFMAQHMKGWKCIPKTDDEIDKINPFIVLCYCTGRAAEDEERATASLKEKGW